MVDGNLALERFVRFCFYGPGAPALVLAATLHQRHPHWSWLVFGVTFYVAWCWARREDFVQTWIELSAPFYRPRAFANGWRWRTLQALVLLKQRIDLQLEWWRDDLQYQRDTEAKRRAQRRYENFLANTVARS